MFWSVEEQGRSSDIKICSFIVLFWRTTVMPAVHSRRVRFARFSSESYSRQGCASVTFYALTVSSQSTRECGFLKKQSKIRGDSQARHERPQLYESIRGEVNVSICILTLALFQVLLARVHSRHKKLLAHSEGWLKY